MPARDVERHYNAVALLQPVDFRAHLLHDSHGLVADDVALMHVGAQHLIEVEVGAANGCGGNPDNRVRGFLDGGVRDVFDAERTPALPCHCFHDWFSLRYGWLGPSLLETLPAKQR
ncbi:hypothetical protein D3C73_1428230 [compost metagenome]